MIGSIMHMCVVAMVTVGVTSTVGEESPEESYGSHGNPYVDNEVPTGELPQMDQCAMINQVQSSVLHILNTHYEYGKGIHMLHKIVEGLQTDFSTLKSKVDEVETRIPTTEIRTVGIANIANATGLTDVSKSIVGLTQGLKNLSQVLETQETQHKSLERKYMGLRRKLKKVTSQVISQVEMGDVDLLEHYMGKQTGINSKLVHRIQALERAVERGSKAQGDSPYIHKHHGGCPPGFIRHFSSCYFFSNKTTNWIDAEKSCQGAHPKAHLVSIETEVESEFLVQYRLHNLAVWASNYLWVGASDMTEEGSWRWVGTSTALNYTNWRPGQPDNHSDDQHCVYFRADGKDPRWDDWQCYAAKLNYVCEIYMSA